jgi:alpha-methylacyl-CoA racemase
LLLAFGMTCALLERQRSGRGQTIDAAMFEGAALLATSVYAQRATGWWRDERGANLLDTGAHFYEVYETRDGRYVAVGAIESQFYAELLKGMGLDPATLPPQMDRANWPRMKQVFADVFRSRTRDEWTATFQNTDACVTPVLSPEEARQHEHCRERNSFHRTASVVHPAPAPRFDRSVPVAASEPPVPGQHSEQVLKDFGFGADEIRALRAAGALGRAA